MTRSANQPARELAIAVPQTVDEALAPAWLSAALEREVASVAVVETIKTVATKLRFKASFADGGAGDYCIKGLLDTDDMTRLGGSTCVLEGDFYIHLAPRVNVRVPEAVVAVTDREAKQSVLIMRDVIAAGGRFCSALDPFTADEAAASVEQLAYLHAASSVLATTDWVRPRAAELARMPHMTAEILQGLLDGPRGDNLTPAVRSGARLIEGMKALADRSEAREQFLVHGDAHAGNIFLTGAKDGGGPGLIDWQVLQRGTWAIDVAYHLCAVLPVELAEAEERRLLGHYLRFAGSLGVALPQEEEAWRQYREAVMYGYYMWGITRRVAPDITVQFTDRLGRAVMRHDSFGLLGVA